MHQIVKKTINSKLETLSSIKKQEIVGLTGDEAVAFAVKQSRVDVVPAYPITPQTIIVEKYSEYVANGEVNSEFMLVESEHSAMSAAIGASLTGARVFTATSSQGMALMHEVLYNASGMRLPIVLANANRALSAPINIHGDHSDMMGSRDCGWIQIFAENAQETYDWTIQAFKIAENEDVQLPVIVNLDGFTITHALQDLSVLKDDDVKEFLPDRKPNFTLDPSNPMTFGGLSLPEYYFDVKKQQNDDMMDSINTIDQIVGEFRKISGREYGVLEAYEMDDAEVAILSLGSTSGTIRSVVKKMRKEGKKIGLIKLWLYRPFPREELLVTIKKLKTLVVMDRAISFGAPMGPLGSDVASSLLNTENQPKIMNVVYGIGGRDLTPNEIENFINDALKVEMKETIKGKMKYVGVKE